ncbi:P-loop containing nucleoside triphosphate hydrolase [Vibrio phage 1.162.O._10N.261.48.E3]|nr:P-loop containing nucleoside triphosphate hydrolase [Vibrio phage 1.147.O._10N.286.49.E9]AUR91723.1 P-loop containing nucleoside triphosphate hydrolase [Vibrio phage 1.162.O._10N.261.48.E3]
MSIIEGRPSNPEVSTCDKHGEYEHQYVKVFDGKYMERTSCPECVAESHAAANKAKELELAERKALSMQQSKEWCGITRRNSKFTFDTISAETEKQKSVKGRMIKWLADFKKDKHSAPSVIMTGKVGTGKTVIASCLIDDLVSNGVQKSHADFYINYNKARILKLIDMIRMLKGTWRRDSEKSEAQLIAHLSGLDLLIIDEVGMGFDSDTEKMFIFDVIDERYQNELPTILISNLNIEGIKDSIGDRSIDRLRDGGGILLGMDWESFRK